MIADGGPARLALALAIVGSLAMCAAHAQEADPPQGEAYADRIIAQQQLQDLPLEEEESTETDGLPRSFRVEAVVSRNEYGDDAFDEAGISAGGFWQTAAWGAFSLDATLFDSDRARFNGLGDDSGGLGGSVTLWQRDLHLDGGWRVNNGLGVLNTPSTPLQRNQYRFFLPTVTFAGASSEWIGQDGGLLLQGALGRAGLYTGTRLVGFDLADGEVGAVAAQWQWAPQWTGAASFLATQGRIVPDDLGEAVFEQGATQALYAATAWQGERERMQLNLLGSDIDSGSAVGVWIDASAVRGRYLHNYGAYRLEEDLSWGALPINNDVEGGYYRISYQYARWSWNAGLDSIRSLSGAGFDGLFATGYARYQANSTLGYGASLNLRDTANRSHSVQLFADKRTSWGQSRLQLDQAGSGGRSSDSWQVALDQAFPMQQGSRLSASVGYGSLRYDDDLEATRTATLSLYGGHDLSDRISIDGTVRRTHGEGGEAFRGTDFNIGLNWALSPRWSLTAAFYQSQGSRRSPFILDPLVTETPFISLPRNRSVFLTLRYARSAGRPQGVIGGSPNSATGAVAGSLFLDDNDDGVRSASEQPAANVTVVLDGRYAVRTDSLGNFEFPRVVAGTHTLEVVPDNLPLPWFVEQTAAKRTFEVRVRQTQRIDIGARRQR
jgi:hypothetical protein